jgi:hypothetical protein
MPEAPEIGGTLKPENPPLCNKIITGFLDNGPLEASPS